MRVGVIKVGLLPPEFSRVHDPGGLGGPTRALYVEGSPEDLFRVGHRIIREKRGAGIALEFRGAPEAFPGAAILAPRLSLNRLLGVVYDACLSEGLVPRISLAPKDGWPAGFRRGNLVILDGRVKSGGVSRGGRAPGQRASETGHSGTSVGLSD